MRNGRRWLLAASSVLLVIGAAGAWLATRETAAVLTPPAIEYSNACTSAILVRSAPTPRVRLQRLAGSLRRRDLGEAVAVRRALPFLGGTTIPASLQRVAVMGGDDVLLPAVIAISHRGSPATIRSLLACGSYRRIASRGRGSLYRPSKPVVAEAPPSAGLPTWPLVYSAPGVVIGGRSDAQLARALAAIAG